MIIECLIERGNYRVKELFYSENILATKQLTILFNKSTNHITKHSPQLLNNFVSSSLAFCYKNLK